MGSRKINPRRIERLEAFERSLKIQDAKRRMWESFTIMTEEEIARLYFALVQICAEKDPREGETLFRGGLASEEQFEGRGRPGWRRWCETGGHAAVMDFCKITDGGSSELLLEGRPFKVLFEGVGVEKSRKKGVSSHVNRLGGRRDKKETLP